MASATGGTSHVQGVIQMRKSILIPSEYTGIHLGIRGDPHHGYEEHFALGAGRRPEQVQQVRT